MILIPNNFIFSVKNITKNNYTIWYFDFSLNYTNNFVLIEIALNVLKFKLFMNLL